MSYVVIRVRGGINIRHDIRMTLELLNLNRVNHCTVIPRNDSTAGMLQKVKDYVTWGEVTEETLARLLIMRGRLEGNDPISDAHIKKVSSYKSIMGLSSALLKGETRLTSVRDMKPVLRLHPPRKGWGGIKRSFTNGGALGYRGNSMDDLIGRML